MSITTKSHVSQLPFGSRGFFGAPSRLFAKDDGGDPGGTGDAGKGDKADPPLFTEEQQKALTTLVNSALTNQLRRALPAALETAMKPITEQLGKLQAPPEPPAGDKGDTSKKMADPELEKMRTDMALLVEKNRLNEERAVNAEKKAKNDKARALLIQSYTEATGNPALAKTLAVAAMAEGEVDFDDAGEPVMKIKKPIFPGGPTEDAFLSIPDAVGNWAKSKDAEPFLAPPKPSTGGKPPVGGGFGKPRARGEMPKLSDPRGVAAAEAMLRDQAKQNGMELPD